MCWPAPVVRVKPEADTLLTVPAAPWPKGPASTRLNGLPGTIRPGTTTTARRGEMTLSCPPAGTTRVCLRTPGVAIRAADGATSPVTDGVVSPVTDTATRSEEHTSELQSPC